MIWANRHLLIGKVNSLPPAACRAVCDIDVGDAHSIAQRARPGRTQDSRKVGRSGQRIFDGADNLPVYFSVGITNRGDHKEECRRYSMVYRLQTSESADEIDDLTHAFDQRLTTGYK